MILSDKSIAERVYRGALVSSDIEPKQIQPASLDVRLGSEVIDVESGGKQDDEFLTIHPHRRYLGHTEEVVNLPDDIAAQLAGRSTIGRMGIIVHKTAGWIDPGFEGQVTLELYNLGTSPVDLEAGSRIAQLVFLQLDHKSSGYSGQYQGQMGATEAGN